jgi:hypothetical protein
VGTAQYLSPEQAQGLEVTAASDVYSLGVVGFECLTGARPFDGASQVAIALAHINRPPPPLPTHIPPAVRLLIERSLAKDPADRFPDGAAFAEAIRRVASGGTLTPVVPAAGPRTTPTMAVGGAAAAGLAGGALTGGLAGAALAESRTQVIPATGPGVLAAANAPATGPAGPMPPLQAPPEDDWDPVDDEDPRGGRGKWVWLSAAVLVLLFLVGGTWYLLNDGNRGPGDATAGTSTAQTSAAPTGIQLDPAAFIGRPADEVQAQLKAAGLTVTQKDADDAELTSAGTALDAGDVAGLRPAGVLATPGTAVVLYVAQKAYDPAGASEPPATTASSTKAAPTTTPPPTSSAPTTSSSSSSSSSVAQGSSEPPPSDPPADPPPADGAPAPGGAG